MNAEPALTELLEVSPQIRAAVIAERPGALLASSYPSGDDRGRHLAELADRMLDEADEARAQLGREPVVQLEIATPDGSVFVVSDGHHTVLAATDDEPTVGLVFYDLKTVLRSLRTPEGADR